MAYIEEIRPSAPPRTRLPDAPAARSLLDVFAATVATASDRLAIDSDKESLTYRQLADRAGELAGRLRALGVGPGDRVGVRVPSGTAQLYVAILGVLGAGAAYVPVDADDPPARAAAAWESAGACAVIEDDLAITERERPRGCDRVVDVDDDAWVIFTSGSTGMPKGVAVTHRSAAAFVDAEARLWSVTARDRVLAGLSVGFDASCEEMWLAWRNGAALVPAPRAVVRAGADLGPWLVEHGVTVVSTVPTLAAMLDDEALAGVRLLILGGEACPDALGWRLAREREVWNTYGPTEATVVTTAARVRPRESVTIGRPLDGWRVAVVDELGEPVPLGEPGELVIAGVGLGRYLSPDLDAERFTAMPALGWDRVYRTGDVVFETADGLRFVGRCDDQVKLGGRRVELGEIDAQLSAVAGVRAAAAAVQSTAAGNAVLAGYVVGDVDPAEVRAQVAEWLPDGIVPLIVPVDSLPTRPSGKVDRDALPWPPPAAPRAAPAGLSGTAAWLAEQWAEQLGPLAMSADSDFFELGGSSVAAAKLVSRLRARFPAVAVADVYNHRRLGDLAARLEAIGETGEQSAFEPMRRGRRWDALQLAGVFVLLSLTAPTWLVGIFAYNNWEGIPGAPHVGWLWLIAGWLLFASAPGRALIIVVARRLLLGRVEPGRYPRTSWLAFRLWFAERLGQALHIDRLGGTPFAARLARLAGAEVGEGARLGTLPTATSNISIGAGATLEPDVDVHGWWVEGGDIVIGELRIGAGARIGSRTLLMPGADIGAGAEIEPGSVVSTRVPAGERWAGSPAARVGRAGEDWPADAAPPERHPSRSKALYAAGLTVLNVIPFAAALPAFWLLSALGANWQTTAGTVASMVLGAPLIAAGFLIVYSLIMAVVYRAACRLVRPGWHPDHGVTAWALWFAEQLMDGSRKLMFPLYATVYTRPWLRLIGLDVGRYTEMSTAEGLSPMVSIGETSFVADAVMLATGRARGGWLHVAPIEVGNRTFVGNGAVLTGGTRLGNDSLVGALSSAPPHSADGTSWLGMPPLELPRVPARTDPSRTTRPPRRLVVARSAIELVRILLPAAVSIVLSALVYFALDAIGRSWGVWPLIALTPVLLTAAGVCAALLTVAAKWVIIGRYKARNYPLWSVFVWRDEVVNSCQEQLAGGWLLHYALGTPLMSLYLRAMGAKVGRGVWCETLAITEFDQVMIGDGCVVNRGACIETHVFHDRVLSIGPSRLEPMSTLGPSSVVLPDTTLGAGSSVGGRSVVLRGESLPPGTRWHGAPVVSV